MNHLGSRNDTPVPKENAQDVAASPGAWLEPPQPQDLLLTLLADNVRNRLEKVWSGGLVKLLDEFGFSRGASRVALGRMAQKDLVSRLKEGRVVCYQLTGRTERLLREGDQRIFALGHDDYDDDGVTVLMHALLEEHWIERARLSRRLRFLRFSPLQDSTWISAGNREEEVLPLLAELGVAEYCSIVVGRMSTQPPLQSMLERAWDLSALSQRYDAFVAAFSKYYRASPTDDRTAFWVRTQLIHNFRQFPSLDPGVSDALWPHPPSRAVAIDLFATIYRDLADPAHRYFDEVTSVAKAGVR